MNLIIAERTGRTEAELLESIGVQELRRWYGHLELEQEEHHAALEQMKRG